MEEQMNTSGELLLKLGKTPSPQSEIQTTGFCSYLRNFWTIAIPTTITMMTWNIQSFIGLYYVGQMNNVIYLDAYSLGMAWVGIIAFSIVVGFSSALDTLVSQSFGKKDYEACGNYFNRGLFLVFLTSLPCYGIIALSFLLFNLLGIDPEVAEHAYICCLSLIPAVILDIPLLALERFLLGQKIAHPQTIIQAINTILCPFYTKILVINCGFGYYGAALSKALSEFLYTMGMILYIVFSGSCSKTLHRPTKEIFNGWKEYYSIAIPSMLMIGLDWWSYASINLIAAKLGLISIAANTISENFAGLIFLSSTGMGIASGTLVGNSVGEQNIKNAKIYAYLGICMTLLVMLTIIVVGYFNIDVKSQGKSFFYRDWLKVILQFVLSFWIKKICFSLITLGFLILNSSKFSAKYFF